MSFTAVRSDDLSESDLKTCTFFERKQAYLRITISGIEFISDLFIYNGD